MRRILIIMITFIVIPWGVSSQEINEQSGNEGMQFGISEVEVKDSDVIELSDEDMDSSEVIGFGALAVEDNESPRCFDYYTFQSVTASISGDKGMYEPGETVKLNGTLTNKNDYPVVDGTLFVRVSQKSDDYVFLGNDVVDEVVVLEGIAIDKNNTKDISFTWTLPEKNTGSEYVFDYFFSVGNKFNLGGLPFTNEIIAGQTIVNAMTSHHIDVVQFDRYKTKVNGVKYRHIGTWPEFPAGEKIVIDQPIINLYSEDKKVEVTYELFSWDSLDKKDLLDTKKETILVSANKSESAEYIIPSAQEAVYYLKITAIADNGDESIVNIRVTSPQPNLRLNYPAITKFPLEKGDDVTLFSCFHSGAAVGGGGVVEIKMYDKKGSEISSAIYEGNISPNMEVVKQDIQVQKDYEYIKLKAIIKNEQGEIVDEYENVYDCKVLNNCKHGGGFVSVKIILYILALILPIAVIIYLISSRRKNR